MTAFPLGASVTLEQLETDPHPVHAALREREPVSWLPALGGWLLLDDAQAPSHRRTMHAVTADGGLEWYSLRRWTLDDIGRWATLAHRPA